MAQEKITTQHQTTILSEITQVFNQIPFNKMLGLQLDAVEDDHISASFEMKKELVGNFLYGILHGGVISSVLDVTGGVAAMIAAVKKYPEHGIDQLAAILGKTSTINLQINYLQPGKGDKFIAKAWVQHAGRKIIFTRMELHNEEHLLATGMAAYRVG